MHDFLGVEGRWTATQMERILGSLFLYIYNIHILVLNAKNTSQLVAYSEYLDPCHKA
jgi:hypothetical protein